MNERTVLFLSVIDGYESLQWWMYANIVMYNFSVLVSDQWLIRSGCCFKNNFSVNVFSGCNFLLNIENKFHKSSCVETYYQCTLQSTESNMLLELLSQMISEPCQNILRTQVCKFIFTCVFSWFISRCEYVLLVLHFFERVIYFANFRILLFGGFFVVHINCITISH